MEFEIGDEVVDIKHLEWGIGMVIDKSKNSIAIEFEKEDYQLHDCNGLCDNLHGLFYTKSLGNLNDLRVINKNDINTIAKRKWEFTDDEKFLLRNVDYEYSWISRDDDNNLYLFKSKPFRDEDGYWHGRGAIGFRSYNHLFNTIRCDDKEPCEFRKYL